MPIEDEAEYRAALKAVRPYFESELEHGTPEAEHYLALVQRIEDYERRHYPIPQEPALAYPARITEAAPGEFLVTFRDIPEAISGGASFTEAATQAADALRAAIAGLAVEGRSIPPPSAAREGEHLVHLVH